MFFPPCLYLLTFKRSSSLMKKAERSKLNDTLRKDERWAAQKNKMSKYGTKLEEQVNGIGDYNSRHTGNAGITDNQTTTLSDAEAKIEAQQKRKRDVQYFDLSPSMDVKKRKVDEERLEVESPESRKNRMRDLYYAGLASSMSPEQSAGAEIQVENDEDQRKQRKDLQSPALSTLDNQSFDNDKLRPDIDFHNEGPRRHQIRYKTFRMLSGNHADIEH